MSVNCVQPNITILSKLRIILSSIGRVFLTLVGALIMLPAIILCMLKFLLLFGFFWCVFDAFFLSRFF